MTITPSVYATITRKSDIYEMDLYVEDTLYSIKYDGCREPREGYCTIAFWTINGSRVENILSTFKDHAQKKTIYPFLVLLDDHMMLMLEQT